jgi:hypothetical protein
LVVRGETNQIFYRFYDIALQAWGNWVGLPYPGGTIDSPAAIIVDSTLQIVVRGVNNDQIWYCYVNLTDNTLSSWTLLDGATPSAPTLTTNGTTLCLVVRGETDLIWYRFYNISSQVWSNWVALPSGATIDGPAATFTGNQVQIVVRGENFDQIWQGALDASTGTFSSWTLLDGATPSKPTLTN